jgi:hypothetical protein
MILDSIKLSGRDAYLLSEGEVNLADPAPVANQRARTGTHDAVGKGMLVEVSGIFFQIEGEDLLPLFQKQSYPIISIEVLKEMFPGLKKDPYKHRVHTVGGYDDFNRSSLKNLRAMEVDGYPTLVSVGNDVCNWTSPLYSFSKKFTIDSGAWYLPSAKLTPKEGFSYSMELHFWRLGDSIDQPAPHSVSLAASGTGPDSERWVKGIDATVRDVIAYQLEFEANVKHDTYLKERTIGSAVQESLGRPLLRTVSLLEVTAPRYDFYSLQELITASATQHLFEEHDGKLKKINATLYLTAALEEGESISVTVNNNKIPAANKLTYVDARLAGEVKLRPPVIDKM